MTLAENIAFGPKTRKLDMDIDSRCAMPPEAPAGGLHSSGRSGLEKTSSSV